MKVKIDASGFRFRLDAQEVKKLSHEKNVELEVRLGEGSLDFVLGTIVDEWPVCVLESGRLSVHLPAVWLVKWPDNELSGFEFDIGGLNVIVEKDFPCKHGAAGRSEYPPPQKMTPGR